MDAPDSAQTAASGPLGEYVLVVDEDDNLRDALVAVIGSEGFNAEAAKSGRDALEKLRWGLRPSLILVDLRMNEMSGWDFRVEQKRDPVLAAIPVIAMSVGLWKKQDVYDFADCLPKPVSREDLRAKLRMFCG
jgi:CheY-like chemotaxis protein